MIPANAGKAVLAAVDKGVGERWEAATHRAARTYGTTDQRVAQVRKMFARELATAGALVGGAAAVPAVGTGAAVALSVAELGWLTVRIADMVLTIAAIHGHSEADVEERRAWVLSILVFGDGAFAGFTKVAGEVGKGLGGKAVNTVSAETLRSINRALGRTIVTKYGTKRGAIALGRVLPFGIGAAIGSSANYYAARAIARQSNKFFSQLAPAGLPTTGS
jgi:hypothetical protein